MLRIISGLLLLIISQFSFASISTTGSVVPATSTYIYKYRVRALDGTWSAYSYTSAQACTADAAYQNSKTTLYTYTGNDIDALSSNPAPCNYTRVTKSSGSTCTYPNGSCSSAAIYAYWQKTSGFYCPSGGVLSDSLGVASESGSYCNTAVTVDSCSSYNGQSGYFWVNKVSPPSTICSGTCLASAAVVAGFPDADPLSWIYLQYTYTGETSGCSADSGFTDDATAAAANAAAAERERLAKIQKAIDDAITACGGVGFYTTGTFNGQTQIVCTNQDSVTNKTDTTTTTSGSTTTDTTSTTTNNTGKTTTVNSDGTTTVTGGSTTSSGKTSTTTTKTNPDGSTTTTTATSGATGTCSESDMKGTAGCAQMGEIPETDDLSADTVDVGSFSEKAPFSDSGQCPADIVITSTLKVSFLSLCNAASMIRPVLLAIAWIFAAYIMRGRNMKEDD